MIPVISALHVIGSIGLYRIAKYTCCAYPWLAFIPVVNLAYMCLIEDELNVESMECKWSIHTPVVLSTIAISILGFVVQKYINTDATIIAGRIMFFSGLVATIINILLAYYGLVDKALPWFWLMLPLSVILLFAPLIFIGSFTLPKRVDSELEEYYDSDVDAS